MAWGCGKDILALFVGLILLDKLRVTNENPELREMLEKPVRADQSKDNVILLPNGEFKRDKNGKRVYKRHRRYRPRKQKN